MHNYWKKSAAQVNTLVRLNSSLNKQQTKILANSLKYANINYYPIVWHIFWKKPINKIEKSKTENFIFLQWLLIRLKILLKKSDESSMEVRRIITMSLEIFKSLQKISPSVYGKTYLTNEPM